MDTDTLKIHGGITEAVSLLGPRHKLRIEEPIGCRAGPAGATAQLHVFKQQSGIPKAAATLLGARKE